MSNIMSPNADLKDKEDNNNPIQKRLLDKDVVQVQLINGELALAICSLDLKEDAPTAYIIDANDLEILDKLKDTHSLNQIVFKPGNRSSRFRAISIRMKKNKISFFQDWYLNIGKLKNGIKKTLEQIHDKEGPKLFIVGIEKPLFESLYKEAETNDPKNYKQNLTMLSQEEQWALEILEQLGDDLEEVPKRLEEEFVGSSPSCELVRQLIIKAGKVNANVLIEGAPGTGKELVAKNIRKYSHCVNRENTPRKKGPFKSINVSAISKELLEAELFGTEPGFLSENHKGNKGLFLEASGGTLFLDEIGDMDLNHQKKVLRAIQEGVITPVGSNKDIPVDVRILAATNRKLKSMISSRKKLFRQDLYDRIGQFKILTPSLSAHLQDLPKIADHLWKKEVPKVFLSQDVVNEESRTMPDLPAEIITELKKYDWEGNVRGLKNMLIQLRSIFGVKLTKKRLQSIMDQPHWVEDEKQAPKAKIPYDLIEIIDDLAKASHEAWKKQREEEGWQYGQEVDNALKTNPHMKKWKDLSEEKKKYARNEARVFIRALLQSGFQIEKTG